MEINWWAVIIAIAGGIVLIAYLLRQNKKDKRDLVKKLNEDYKKREESELNDEN